ncbi:transposase [Aliiglaciecola sp. CAU 1673]|uniref:transposase n=1 Tax=Aliiglaciecola sp. CAU 1673 TaxID=3032595 RepID=UPI0023DC8717|nr:transposase [Aliiglaciecola sp. CAU 1673]MDF2176843.1 transposase [Aliiglaciecola sp. CAU 1673]
MPKARKAQVSLEDTPYYHCVSRCVRRAYLCGEDKHSGKSYEHRRQWVEDELLRLGQVFAIDICAYAVMSNHTHVVLFVDKAMALSWSVEEVLNRWHSLHKGTLLTRRFMDKDSREAMSQSELMAVQDTAEVYRQRLYDISWFMRQLNESIARRANKEDGCTGRFWEGRFKSQALLDEAALAACMAYVDLNPLRAKMADTPEASAHTSICQRAVRAKQRKAQPQELAHFVGNPRQVMPKGLPFRLRDYLELVDQTGRCIRENKRGYIEGSQSPILQRLGLDAEHWLTLARQFEQQFCFAAGTAKHMQEYKAHIGQERIRGMSASRMMG